jgi:hypothetical protein
MNSELLETLIESWRVIGTHEPDAELRREAFKRMSELVAQRKPEQIERIERSQGLRA